MSRSRLSIFLAFALVGVLGAQQPNTADASLIINGLAGPPYPINPVPVFSGVNATMAFAGLSGSPITLGQSPNLVVGFANTSIGIVDLNLANATVLLNGQRSIDFNGALTLTIAAPTNLAAGLSMSYQAAILSLTAPAGAVLTAATRITTAIGVVGANVSPGDDSFVAVSLTPHNVTAAYYASTYNQFFVNSNGSMSFSSGSGDFMANSSAFLTQMPRIAPYWTDLSPNVGGTVSWQIDFTQLPPLLTVRFVNVPSGFGAGGLFSFSSTIQLTPQGVTPLGDIQIINPVNNPASPYDTLVGISPGSSLSTQTAPLNLSALQAAGGHTGGPMQAIFEFFQGTTSTTGLPGSIWDLTGSTLTFFGMGVGMSGASYFML